MGEQTSASPVFRVAVPSDLHDVANMVRRLAVEAEAIILEPDVVEAGVRAVLEDGSKGTYYLVEVDNVVAGQLMIAREWSDWRNARIWRIQSVYVSRHFRRKGLFRALYAHVKAEAIKQAAYGLRLYADVSNDLALKTYDNLGLTSHYKVYEDMFDGPAPPHRIIAEPAKAKSGIFEEGMKGLKASCGVAGN